MPETDVEDSMLMLVETFSEKLIDNGAVLVKKSPPAETEAWRGSTAGPRNPYANEKKGSVIGTEESQRSQTRGKSHNVLTHFPKDPNCDVCMMTNTTRARRKHRPLRRADGIAPPTTFGDLTTTDHKNLESRR